MIQFEDTPIAIEATPRGIEETTSATRATQRVFEVAWIGIILTKIGFKVAQRSLVDITSAIGSTLPWLELTEAQGQVTADRSIW
ncbi:MAG TPA: hypothetical protein VMB50_21080 [Myxococcales bacterium]|nr:hypothetical protein [Myxococcales bacterium]